MALTIYNSLARKKQPFTPLEAGKVRIYVCGMTVYDYCHLGHARMLMVFDMVVRYLRARGFDVLYVRNITDIDDKIIGRAKEKGEPFDRITARFIEYMNEDTEALGILRPDLEPRATQHIPAIIALIEKLVARNYAYCAENGDVYFRVSAFDNYGQLSGKRTEDLRSGARVEVDESKDDPLDFVLWKAAKPDEPYWDSPWGPGRPGWHIECSAMSMQCLGEHFDIHGGGQDLQFPHHENEIAQSEGATGRRFVETWMHNGFVRIDEEKMSKSLGNFFTVREVLKSYRPEEIRFFMLSSHYRSPLNYSTENLEQAKSGLTRLYTALRGIPVGGGEMRDGAVERFYAAMDDDFNTSEAVAVLFDLAREINRERDVDPEHAQTLAATMKQLGGILGLLEQDPDTYLQGEPTAATMSDAQVERLIARRNEARTQKDWTESDRIRDELAAAGIIVEDGPQGSTWRRA